VMMYALFADIVNSTTYHPLRGWSGVALKRSLQIGNGVHAKSMFPQEILMKLKQMSEKKLNRLGNYSIPELGADNFDWITWLNGADIWLQLGFKARYFSILDNKETLRKYAVGYIPGYKLYCRPEPDEIAVLFAIGDITGWTHLRREEFERTFSNVG
jgi:hypothetical protein